jgi:sec-independent protein translocase protein TatB
MSFSETIFLFVLALVIFGPKKLPEIARQAGKLLAELRRASNEFKSQIETEIAHLEVEKKQTMLPPAGPPEGAVASMSLNPASEASSHSSDATLAGTSATPVADSNTNVSDLAVAKAAAEKPSSESTDVPATSSVPAGSSASQDSHV